MMEIPDVIAITKADRPGVDLLQADLRAALSLVPGGPWTPPIVPVRAREGIGADALWEEVRRHRAFLAEGDRLAERRRDGLARQLRSLALDRLGRRLEEASDARMVEELIDEVLARRLDPPGAVDRVLERAGLTAG
jgi:LAO/AO transport system kinase